MSGPDNFSRVVLRAFNATPSKVILREMPSPNHSWNRWPAPADVRTGTIYGEGQNYQTGYLTGTMSAGGGGATVVYTWIG